MKWDIAGEWGGWGAQRGVAEEWSGLPGCGRPLGCPGKEEGLWGRLAASCRHLGGQQRQRKRGQRRGASAALGLGREGRGCTPSPLAHLPHPQVTLIPTFDSVAMHEWYEETHPRHRALGITVLGSNSTVSMQDEAFPACKLEF